MKIKTNKNLAKLTPKKFILNHLIPFILRDAGHGFAMDSWKEPAPKEDGGKEYSFDDIYRRAPACGTVACIGGSIQCLTGLRLNADRKMAHLLGITPDEVEGLFYSWMEYEDGWPKKFAERFTQAETPYQKARVACALLRQIALKGSKVFDYKREQENN